MRGKGLARRADQVLLIFLSKGVPWLVYTVWNSGCVMAEEKIVEIGVDQLDRVYIKPFSRSFEQIHRAAMQVYWDSAQKCLHSPKATHEAGKWTHIQWFQQIIDAVADEYGVHLVYTPSTILSGVSETLYTEIKAARPFRYR